MDQHTHRPRFSLAFPWRRRQRLYPPACTARPGYWCTKRIVQNWVSERNKGDCSHFLN